MTHNRRSRKRERRGARRERERIRKKQRRNLDPAKTESLIAEKEKAKKKSRKIIEEGRAKQRETRERRRELTERAKTIEKKGFDIQKAEQKAKEIKAAATRKQSIVKPGETLKTISTQQPIVQGTKQQTEQKSFIGYLKSLPGFLNPFNKKDIQLTNIDNRVFRTGAEYVVNNPLTAATMFVGGFGILKALGIGSKALTSATGKFAIGKLGNTAFVKSTGVISKKGLQREFSLIRAKQSKKSFLKLKPTRTSTDTSNINIDINTNTAGKMLESAAGVMANMKKPAFVLTAVGGIIGSYMLSGWAEIDNIRGAANIMTRDISELDDPAQIEEAIRIADEIFDPSMWEKIGAAFPGTNLAVAYIRAGKVAAAMQLVSKQIAQDRIIQLTTGETDDEKFERIRIEKQNQIEANALAYEQSRKQLFIWEEEAKEDIREKIRRERKKERETIRGERKGEREDIEEEREEVIKDISREERRAREEEARFWANERQKQRDNEAEDRKAIADFWFEYRKTVLQLANDNRPSNLNFGLL